MAKPRLEILKCVDFCRVVNFGIRFSNIREAAEKRRPLLPKIADGQNGGAPRFRGND